jgi:hypothetical protein
MDITLILYNDIHNMDAYRTVGQLQTCVNINFTCASQTSHFFLTNWLTNLDIIGTKQTTYSTFADIARVTEKNKLSFH